MKDPWLNFQYTIEFSDNSDIKHEGVCSVMSISSNAIRHGSSSYVINSVKGGPVRKYVYGGTYTDPINISILLGQGARPWLRWFASIQSGNGAVPRNVTISLRSYGNVVKDQDENQIWLCWDLLNCFPVSWQIGSMGVDDSPSPMKVDMTLQFESMVVRDASSEMQEIMG